MGEEPRVKLTAAFGRNFMLAEQVWFDIDMARSSAGLPTPRKDTPAVEQIKYAVCRNAIDTYKSLAGRASNDHLVSELWFKHGFLPCHYIFHGVRYIALVTLRGVCWVDFLPSAQLDTEGPGYRETMLALAGAHNNVRDLIRTL